MGEVIELAAARAARARRAAAGAVMHPCLRWTAAGGGDAHRRDDDGRAACGATGMLALAPAGTRLCPACYPPIR